ncbi:MAG: hypothetical protein H7Z12_17650 [Rhodospirillaceae bacterium]|nr:hypothetical protein [Rhodospirillales bacterium]
MADDLATTCWTCEPLQAYVDLSQEFVDRLSDALQTPMLIMFASFAGLWIVVSGVKLALRMTDLNKIAEEFIYVSITGVLLGSLGVSLIAWNYSTSLDIMGGASSSVFSLATTSKSTGYTGLVALAANGEQAVYKVFQAAGAIVSAGSLYRFVLYVYAVLLVVPYFLLVVVYSSQVVVAIFRVTMVGVFGPFLFMAFAFGWGRDMAKSGAKTLLAAVVVLFASTAALSITIFGVSKGITFDPKDMTGDTLNQFASVSNPKFLVILFLGWMGTALMTEGTAIANSIAQTALTNTAAGILSAGVAGSAMAGAKHGLPMAGNALAGISRGFFAGQKAMADPAGAVQNLVNKFQNINKPGS